MEIIQTTEYLFLFFYLFRFVLKMFEQMCLFASVLMFLVCFVQFIVILNIRFGFCVFFCIWEDLLMIFPTFCLCRKTKSNKFPEVWTIIVRTLFFEIVGDVGSPYVAVCRLWWWVSCMSRLCVASGNTCAKRHGSTGKGTSTNTRNESLKAMWYINATNTYKYDTYWRASPNNKYC